MKKKELKNFKEKPLEYWEKESYMIIIPKKILDESLDEILNRLDNIK